jgi:glycosyltransferase involved in cell wall biosynthesis
MTGRRTPRLAYVVSEYPKVSHTFVMREVEALRRLGAEVDTVSIRRTPEEQLLSEADRRAARQTFSVLPVRPGRLVGAHARWALRHPHRYAEALALSFRVGPAGLRNRLWQLFYFVEAAVLADELRRRGTEHLHAHFVNVACSVVMLAARLLRVPYSFTMHGPLEFDNVDQHGVAAKAERAEFVACISDFCRAQLMRLVGPEHWAKLHVVHCGVEPHAYATAPPERNGTAEILSVGRLAPMKGYAVLLEALDRLLGDGEQVRLTLVGDGPDRPRLEDQARRQLPHDAVTFTGALSSEEVARRMGAADVFCLPSFAEGVPVVLMEAMAAGLPVVATSVMGIPELVRAEAGRLVAPGRADALADALRAYIRDPAARAAAGEAGRAIVTEEFDVDRSAQALADLFTSTSRGA